ncbi:ATPase inhibitor subunit zeta [Kordiimonas aquimaris]|uniref:ATPase inhibitor subunit zeta n=1 Tax=Kordiimonas aquimaris TaxID=707591 RepID=UPI0021CDED32|nr:ATPase inhibitor subunit zeta [Kordiimonas aquimaris]
MKQRSFRIFSIAVIAVSLVACSGDNEAAEKAKLYESYTMNDLRAFKETGDLSQAIDAINYYRDQDTATNEHLFLLAELYVAAGDGIAAETLVERLRVRGMSDEDTAVLLAQSVMLQNRFEDADLALSVAKIPVDQSFEAFLLRGDVARSTENYAKAEAFYELAIEVDPTDFRGHAAIALLAIQLADLNKAEKYATAAAERIQDDSIVSYVQGMIARYSGDLDAANSHFTRALELNDTNMLARIEIVGVHLLQDNFEAAQAQLDIIYTRSPNNAMANYYTALTLITEGKVDEAEDILLRTEDFTRAYPPATRVYGLANYELKDFPTAIALLKQAIRFYPNDDNTRLALADSLNQRGQFTQALEVLKLYTDNTVNIQGLTYAAVSALGQSDVSAARKYLEGALSLAEQEPELDLARIEDIKRRYASALYLDGDVDKATSLLTTISEANPDVSILSHKANMLMASGDFTAAEQTAKQILSVQPGHPAGASIVGAVRHRQERYEEAIASYTQALEANPSYQSALKNRALTYITIRDFEKALADIEIVIKSASNDAQLIAMHGRALLETGDAELASEQLQRAVTLMPNVAIVAADYAEALAETGYYSSALTQARRARTLAPNNNEFVAYLEEKSAAWEQAKSEVEASELVARQEEFAKIDAERAEERELREALKADSITSEDSEDENAKVLAELRALAEANRKADEEDRLAREAQLAEEARIQAEAGASEVTTSEEQLAAEAAKQAQLQAERERIHARNRMFGEWLASELALNDAEAQSYIQEVIDADDSEPGNTDIVRKALLDLERAGKGMTIQAIEKKLMEFDAVAQSHNRDE